MYRNFHACECKHCDTLPEPVQQTLWIVVAITCVLGSALTLTVP